MKRIALTVICLLALAAPAFPAAVGDISVYADASGNSCNISAPAGLVQVFVVHKFSDGGCATGARFKMTYPAAATFGGATWNYVPIGDVRSDLSLAYGVLISTTTSLGSVSFFGGAPLPACSYFSILAADNFPNAIATDCSFGEFPVKTGQGIANPDGTCQCNVATEPTSWGRVKALYR